jgi:energy-coupling factor transporter ATP-binding protein EcfA2
MLKRLYANNYRCLVNFEMVFGQLTLLAGPNGGGKSSVFDLLFGIRHLLVDNVRIGDVFAPKDITAWVKNTEQTFELDVQGEEGLYTYKLVVSYNPDVRKQRIDLEQLMHDGKPLFEFNQGKVQLFHDDHTPGPIFSFDWTVSALATISVRGDNRKLTWFKEWIDKLFIVSLQPKAMTSETDEESAWLDRDGTNFASWYRYILQEHQDRTFHLTEHLRVTIPGFHAFKLEKAGKHRILKVGFSSGKENSQTIYLEFQQLSDGQRVLIVLYSLLLGLKDLGQTLFIDEPENYVALAEIQPWLMELNDACGEGIPQAVLISHHPELIDYLGPECGQWMERDPLGPVRIRKLPEKVNEALKLSEQLARGWTE